jgi:hypothetical protein
MQVMAPTAAVADLDALKSRKNYSSAVVTDSGALGGKLLGEREHVTPH